MREPDHFSLQSTVPRIRLPGYERELFNFSVYQLFLSTKKAFALMRSGKTVDIDILNNGYRYALSLCSNRQDAEDIVHDAWIRLDKRYRKAPEKALLYRTIRNLYIDSYRRSQRIHFSEFNEGSHAPDGQIGLGGQRNSTDERITSDEMSGFLYQLRDVEREALYLSVVEGYTADEIAQMSSTARGTVLSLIHRSKTKLRTWMTGANIDGEKIEKAEVVELVSGGKPIEK